jgi:hypothetical protein
MNPSSKHPARLSLGKLLLSPSLVTKWSSNPISDLPLLTSQTVHRGLLSQHLHLTRTHCRSSRTRDAHRTYQFSVRLLEEGSFSRLSRISATQIASANRQTGLHRRAELSGTSQPFICIHLTRPREPQTVPLRCCLPSGPQHTFAC